MTGQIFQIFNAMLRWLNRDNSLKVSFFVGNVKLLYMTVLIE